MPAPKKYGTPAARLAANAAAARSYRERQKQSRLAAQPAIDLVRFDAAVKEVGTRLSTADSYSPAELGAVKRFAKALRIALAPSPSTTTKG